MRRHKVEHKFWTIQEFVRNRNKNASRAFYAVMASVATLLGVAVSVDLCYKSPTTKLFSSGNVTYMRYNELSGEEKVVRCETKSVTDSAVNRNMDMALIAWEKAINQTIKRPRLFENPCAIINCVNQDAIACADTENYTVMLVNKYGYDLQTVFMHEIGHLLGVPHIADDPLMQPGIHPQTTLRAPTPFAVALAKIARGEQK